jgi:hypothetical protein
LTVFVLTFLAFLVAVALMSLGVILSGRRIRGSCGGLGNIPGIEPDCGGACANPCERRRHAGL